MKNIDFTKQNEHFLWEMLVLRNKTATFHAGRRSRPPGLRENIGFTKQNEHFLWKTFVLLTKINVFFMKNIVLSSKTNMFDEKH